MIDPQSFKNLPGIGCQLTGWAIAFLLLGGSPMRAIANPFSLSDLNTDSHFPQIAQNSGNILTAEQLTQLRELQMRVIVPTYIPSGFELTELKIYQGSSPEQGGRAIDPPFYWMIFQDANNTCFRLMSGNQGFRHLPENQISVNTQLFGTITIDYGKSQNRPEVEVIQAGIPLPESYRLDSGIHTGTPCKPMLLEEYIKVLQSIKFLSDFE